MILTIIIANKFFNKTENVLIYFKLEILQKLFYRFLSLIHQFSSFSYLFFKLKDKILKYKQKL